jgi:hypothetical protein
MGIKLSDEEVVGAGGLDRVAGLIACMVPFVSFVSFTAGNLAPPGFHAVSRSQPGHADARRLDIQFWRSGQMLEGGVLV